jgi:hypothetical protein
MSTAAAGQDILQILRMFTSPRMGPFDNTNAPSPAPPEPNSDAARAISDPARYGGGDQAAAIAVDPEAGKRPPAPAAPPPTAPPVPVGRRVLPDPGSTGSVGGSPPAAALGAPAGAPAGSADWLAGNPVAQQWFRQVQEAKAEAARQQSFDLIGSGISDLAGGKYTAGGGGGGAGASPTNIRGDLSVEQLQKFYDADVSAKNLKEDTARIDRIVADPRMKGVSKDALLTLRANNAPAYAKLIADYFSGETDTKTLEDGTIVSRPKNGPADAPYVPVIGDPAKAAKSAADLAKTKADTEKLKQELFDPATANTDEVLRQQAIAMGRNPDDASFIAYLRSVPLPKRQEMLEKNLTAQAAAGGGPAKIFGEEYAKGAVSSIDKGKKSIAGMPVTGKALGMLTNDKAWTGILGTHPGITTISQLAGEIFDMPVQGLTDQQILSNLVATQKAEIARLFPGPVSDKDQKVLDQIIGGDLSQQREALIAIQRRILQGQVAEAIAGRAAVESAGKAFGSNPVVGPYVEASRESFANIPDYTQELFKPEELADVRTAQQLQAQATAPGATPEDRAKVDKYVEQTRKNFDKAYGKGFFDYVLAQPPPPPPEQ